MISTNAAEIARRMLARPQAVRRELERAAKELALLLNAECKRILQERVYNVPIPLKKSSEKSLPANSSVRGKTTKGKHGQWQRTGNLKRSEHYKTDGPAIILTNEAGYAVPRWNLGTPGHRQIRSKGVQSVQWQLEAIHKLREKILARRREAILRALRNP